LILTEGGQVEETKFAKNPSSRLEQPVMTFFDSLGARMSENLSVDDALGLSIVVSESLDQENDLAELLLAKPTRYKQETIVEEVRDALM